MKKKSHLAKCLPPQRLWQTQLATGREEGRHEANGLSTSAEHLGTSIATMTQDGVKMDEINWMQQNINAAQDATETSQGNVETLKERGYSEEQIRNMTPDQHDELANAIRTENDNNTLVANGLDPDTMTPEQRNQALYNLQPDAASPIPALLGAFGSVGGFLAGALGLSIGNGTSSSPIAPANNANAEPLVGRRREDEEGGETATDRDGKIDGETSQSNILNGLTLSSISVAEQNNKGEKETPKKTLVLSPENQKIQNLEAAVQKRRDELDKASYVADATSDNQQSYARTFTLAEAKLNDSIKALEKAKKQQTDRILKTSDGKKLSFELSNARYVMDDILKSNEFKTQTDAMNQSLVAKNVLENIIKEFKIENRPAAEIKIHQDALDRTKDSISKAQASLDSMTKKARKDVDNAKAKLDNFINKERVKENQVIKEAKYSSVDAYLEDKHDREFKDKVSLFDKLKNVDNDNKKVANIEALIKQRDELIKSSGSLYSSSKTEALIQIALSTSEKLKSIDSKIQSLSKEKNDLMLAHKLKLFLTDSDIKQVQDLNQKLNKLENERLNESAKIMDGLKLSDKLSIKTVETIEKLSSLETRIKKEIYELSVQNILTNSLTSDGTNKYTGSLKYLNKPDPTDSRIQDNLVSQVIGLGHDGMPSQNIALKASEAIKIPTVKGKESMDASVFKRAVESVWEKPSTPDAVNTEKKKELLVLRDKIENASTETERKSYQREFDQKNADFMKNDPATQGTLRRNDPAIVNQGANKGMSVQTAVVIQAIRDMGLDNFKPAENLNKDQLAEFKKIKEWIAGKDKNGNLIDPQVLGNQMASAVCKIYAGYSVGVENGSIKVSFGEFLINKFRNADVAFGSNSAPVLDQNRMRGYDNEFIKRYDNNKNQIKNDFETIGVDANGKITGVTNPISVDGVTNYLNNISLDAGDVTLQVYGDTDRKQGGNHYFVIKRINGEWYNLNNNGIRDPLTGLPPKLNYGQLDDGSKEIKVYGIFR